MTEIKLAAFLVSAALGGATAYFFNNEIRELLGRLDAKNRRAAKGTTFYMLERMKKSRAGYLIAVAATALAGAAVGVLFFNNSAAAALCVVFSFLFHRKRVELEFRARKAALDEQAETALQMIASLYETTGDLVEALKGAAGCTPAPMRDELQTTVADYFTGTPLKEALLGFAERTDNRDIDIFVKGVTLSERYGTDTAGVVSDVAAVIRDRILLREELKNEMRGQNLTVNIFLLFLPVVAGGLVMFSPDARQILTGNVFGKLMVCVMIAVEFFSWYFTRSLGVTEEL